MTPPGPAPVGGKVPLRPGGVAARLLILSGLLAVGSLAILGLPGAAWLMLAGPLAGLLTEARAAPDAVWPMAILHSIAWPWILPPAYLLAAGRMPPGRGRWLATLGLTALGAFLIALAFQLAAGRLT